MQDEKLTAADGQICSLRFIAVLRQANFPADDLEQATRDLEYTFERYSTTQAASRNSVFIAELETLNNLAGQLAQAVKGLSGRARQALGYETLKLMKPLRAFWVRTALTRKNTSPDMGGPKVHLKEHDLAFQVAILWRRNFPIGKAVTRTSAGEYRGPLLDFVENVLKLEGVRIQSTNALGKQLYEMRTIGVNETVGPPCSLIDEKARQANSRD